MTSLHMYAIVLLLSTATGSNNDTSHTSRSIFPIVNNTLPTVQLQAITVMEGQALTLSSDHLPYKHISSNTKEVVYTITQPLPHDEGHLMHVDRPWQAVTSFTQEDIDGMKIVYMSPTTEGSTTGNTYSFKYTVTGNGQEKEFLIRVLPRHMLEPHMVNLFPEVILSQGSRVQVDPFVFEVAGFDVDENQLQYVVGEGVKHGMLWIRYQDDSTLQLNTNSKFGPHDVSRGRLMYEHDGSRNLKDSMEVVVTDEHEEVSNRILFTIIPSEDFARPSRTAAASEPLQVLEGHNLTLSVTSLLPRDLKPNRDMLFTLIMEPVYGSLLLSVEDDETIDLIEMDQFGIEDVQDQKLLYHANLEIGSEAITEIVSFNLTQEGPPFWPSRKQVVQITILPVDNYAPLVIVNGGVVVKEGGQAAIDVEAVSVLDLDSTVDSLVVVIERPPIHGHITCPDDHKVVLKNPKSFHYRKLLSGEVRYIQSDHQGVEPLSDAILFHVTDGINASPSTWLNATINLVNDEQPSITVSQIHVTNGEEVALNKETFFVQDLDTEPQHLIVTLLKEPQHGFIRRKTEADNTSTYQPKLQAGQGFVYEDILNKMVFYTHDSSPTTEDTFLVMVTDGEFHAESALTVIIEESPVKLSVNNLLVLTSGTVQLLTPSVLRVESPGTKDDKITFTLQKVPKTGRLEKLHPKEWAWTPMQSKDTFSQADLAEGRVRFAHMNEEQRGDVRFTFEVSVGAKVVLKDQTFVVRVKSDRFGIRSDVADEQMRIHFEHSKLSFREDAGTVHVRIIREGSNLSTPSSVWCTTKPSEPANAAPRMDYVPTAVLVTFASGESQASCSVTILEDELTEGNESFLVVLTQPQGGATLSHPSTLTIVIEDYSTAMVQFGTEKMTVKEDERVIKVPVYRTGDKLGPTSVICFTQQGTAKNGLDFVERPLQESSRITFTPGVERINCEVPLINDDASEGPEQLSVNLLDAVGSVGHGAMLGRKSILVIIDDSHDAPTTAPTLILPAPPVVTSPAGEPIPGHPLMCINSCDTQFPYYNKTGRLCRLSGIDSTSVNYFWEVAEGSTHGKSQFRPITSSLFVAGSRSEMLDPAYFGPKFSIRCVTEPAGTGNHVGIRLYSSPITVGPSGSCPGGEGSFQAELKYVDTDSDEHPNTVRILVTAPHRDGMLPLISTRPLHDPKLLLTEMAHRAQHVCSNLHFGRGFLEEVPDMPSDAEFLYDSDATGSNETVKFYRHLDLESCKWSFSAWYTMSELVDLCEGQVTSDFQLSSQGVNHLTLRIPLHVSYITAGSPSTWTAVEHHTELEVSFYYPTLLWNHGVNKESHPHQESGRVQVTRVSSDSAGHLVVDLRTTALFRGQYILSHSTSTEYRSVLKAPSILNVQMDLKLLWSRTTWDGTQQAWRSTSDLALRDYSGDYTLYLVPCMVSQLDPSKCDPGPPVAFPLTISFRHASRPVPLAYSLNTDFQVTGDKDYFLADPKEGNESQNASVNHGSDMAPSNSHFGRGERIFGKVLWHPSQDLDTAYQLRILRLYACTGRDGHVPTYDPTGDQYGEGPQYGCMESSTRLKHRFLLLDRDQPYVVDKSYNEVPFEAYFAEDVGDLVKLQDYSGVDGFVLNVDALYAAGSGDPWFLQVLYTIGSSRSRQTWDSSRPVRLTRSTLNGSNQTREGTNMKSVILQSEEIPRSESKVHYMWVGMLPVVAIGLGIVCAVRRQNGMEKKRKLDEEGIARCRDRRVGKCEDTTGAAMPLNAMSWVKNGEQITARSRLSDGGTEV